MGFDDSVGVETSAFALRKAWLHVGNSCKRSTFLKIEHGEGLEDDFPFRTGSMFIFQGVYRLL